MSRRSDIARADAEALERADDLRADRIVGLRVSNGFWKIIWIGETVLDRAALDRRVLDRLVIEDDQALARRLEPEQHLGEGRLAAARLADDRQHLAPRERRTRCPRPP